jgi:hypothetical protein
MIKNKLQKSLWFICVFVQVPLLFYVLFTLLELFQTTCPNRDVLSWDANLRYVATLKLMDYLRNWELHQFLFSIAEAPTWPMLRNVIQTIFFLLFGHSTTLDVYITFGTSVLLILTLAHILFYGLKDKVLFPFLFLGAWSSVLLSKPLVAYSFSAMLEIQGALFFSFSVYYFYWFLAEAGSKKTMWLLAFLSFALFQTKYPYGYMFLFGLFFTFIMLDLKHNIFFGIRYLLYQYARGFKNVALILMSVIILSYIFVLPTEYKVGKASGYLKYTLVTLFLIDFFYYFFTQKKEMVRLGYIKLIQIFEFVFLPIIVWVMINPDRFTSSGSTIQHVQLEGHQVGAVIEKGFEYYTVFLRSLIMDAYSNQYAGILIVILLLASLVTGFVQYYKYQRIRIHFMYSLITFCIISGITFLTPNHQARHIYHLYPAIFLASVFFITDKTVFKTIAIQIGLVFLLLAFTTFPLYSTIQSKFSSYIICYTGTNVSDYSIPRWVAQIVDTEIRDRTVVLNYIDPSHVNKADAELFLSQIGYNKKLRLLIDPKPNAIDWKEYKNLLIIGNKGCEEIFHLVYTGYLQSHFSEYKIERSEKIDNGCYMSIRLR